MTDEIIAIIAKAACGGGCQFPRCHCSRREEKQAGRVLSALRDAGFAVVPVEPTEAMLEAGSTSRAYREDGERDEYTDRNTELTWAAMIAAATPSQSPE